MHPAEITCALRVANSSQTHIARELGVTRTMVCGVVNGRKRSRRIETAISQATGLPVTKLWRRRGTA